jgi:aryl-alcohol dehydrogenase-like predicted oxidoreductase
MRAVTRKVSLVLGTAQWGYGYGITSRVDRISEPELRSLVDLAVSSGISNVDSALAYGDAHIRLRPWANSFRVTTKVAGSHPAEIRRQIHEAIEQLGVSHLDACLIHDWESLDSDSAKRAARNLEAVREEGLVKAVGVSVYSEVGVKDADLAFSDLGQVQVPANVLDRRLDDSTLLRNLSDRGARIQVRSALLQGLLAGPSRSRLSRHPAVESYLAYAAQAQINPIAIALAHVRALPWASEIVVGVSSTAELAELISEWKSTPECLADPGLGCLDASLIDPREWTQECEG